jgi:flagellar hook-length control protein FliK
LASVENPDARRADEPVKPFEGFLADETASNPSSETVAASQDAGSRNVESAIPRSAIQKRLPADEPKAELAQLFARQTTDQSEMPFLLLNKGALGNTDLLATTDGILVTVDSRSQNPTSHAEAMTNSLQQTWVVEKTAETAILDTPDNVDVSSDAGMTAAEPFADGESASVIDKPQSNDDAESADRDLRYQTVRDSRSVDVGSEHPVAPVVNPDTSSTPLIAEIEQTSVARWQVAKKTVTAEAPPTSADFDAGLDGALDARQAGMRVDESSAMAGAKASEAIHTIPRQVHDALRMAEHRVGESIEIELDPPELGRVVVQLETDGRRLAARFLVDDRRVAIVLEQHLMSLFDSLKAAEVSVDNVFVGLHQEQAGDGHDRRRFTMFEAVAKRESFGADIEAIAPTDLARKTSRALDIVI